MLKLSLILISLFTGFILFLTPVIAQDPPPDSKRAKLISDQDAPWGLVIQFAPETTVAQETALRTTHGLSIAPGGYHYADPIPYIGRIFDPALYSGMETYHYQIDVDYHHNTQLAQCLQNNTCPPLFVDRVFYEPVDTATEQALLAEDAVAQLDNRRNTLFFFLKLIECRLDQLRNPLFPCKIITPWA